ncbi:uncharacterized protein LOC135834153 [Planococcus citri]|uniref:uncharacterized protein LOC135834153 n=1 Tax=Planococcus citri TaxID=170843 RepID=UPI0031FA3759
MPNQTRNARKRVASRPLSPVSGQRGAASSGGTVVIDRIADAIIKLSEAQATQMALTARIAESNQIAQENQALHTSIASQPKPIANYSSVPVFNPSNADHDIEKWLEKVDELSVVYSWTPAMTINAATSKLAGYAKKWYDGQETFIHTWDEWKELLTDAFQSNKGRYQRMLELMARKKKLNEKFADYYYDKMILLVAAKIPDEVDQVDFLIGGIPDKTTRDSARQGRYKTPLKLLKYLNSIEEPSVPSTSTNDSQSKHVPSAPRTSHPQSDARKKNIECHKCGKKGHYARECEKESRQPRNEKKDDVRVPMKQCEFCKRFGHVEKDCFKKKASSGSGTGTPKPPPAKTE